jgi:excinuclease ABC subunit B
MRQFEVAAPFKPAGDQDEAIAALAEGIKAGDKYQTLQGVTGSGKTFTMAKIIEAVQMPTLVVSHNKTLSAQLYREFKGFFPNNAVEYFVSYYDYYQPEAYVASRDLYIEKDASINDEIERMRFSAMRSMYGTLRRNHRGDCVVHLGMVTPDVYKKMASTFSKGETVDVDALIRRFVELQYERNDAVLGILLGERSLFKRISALLAIVSFFMAAWKKTE